MNTDNRNNNIILEQNKITEIKNLENNITDIVKKISP
jgi:hypothetical protein